jgi:hypothetical protein
MSMALKWTHTSPGTSSETMPPQPFSGLKNFTRPRYVGFVTGVMVRPAVEWQAGNRDSCVTEQVERRQYWDGSLGTV